MDVSERARFVLLSAPVSDEAEKKFIEFINAKGLGFWHWMPGSWLIDTFVSQAIDAKTLRDTFLAIAPGKKVLCMRVEVTDWSAAAPGSAKSNMFEWLHKNW